MTRAPLVRDIGDPLFHELLQRVALDAHGPTDTGRLDLAASFEFPSVVRERLEYASAGL